MIEDLSDLDADDLDTEQPLVLEDFPDASPLGCITVTVLCVAMLVLMWTVISGGLG